MFAEEINFILSLPNSRIIIVLSHQYHQSNIHVALHAINQTIACQSGQNGPRNQLVEETSVRHRKSFREQIAIKQRSIDQHDYHVIALCTYISCLHAVTRPETEKREGK